jgi:hypothetical protein
MINLDQLEVICRMAAILNRCEAKVTVYDLISMARARAASALAARSEYTYSEAEDQLKILANALDTVERTAEEERII